MVRYFKILFLIGIFCVFGLSFVSSAAISGPYDQRRFLEMNPGEVKEFRMVLQNMDGDEDVLFNSRVVKGEEYVSLVSGYDYLVPVGSNNVSVYVRVEVPKDINKNEIDSRIVFDPQQSIDGGTVQVAIGLSWDLKIKILGIENIEDRNKNDTNRFNILEGVDDSENLSSESFSGIGLLIWWFLIGVVVLGIVVVSILIIRKDSN
jgi:hypothetical protein